MSINFKAFDAAYCINLDEDIHRYENMSISNPEIQRFPAIKKPIGRQGCAQSHIEVIKLAKKQNIKNVAIFEDDAIFPTNRQGVYFERVLKSLESVDWSLIKIGYALESDSRGYRLTPDLIQACNTWGTHAYVVNSKYYDIFLSQSRQDEIDRIPDTPHRDRPKLCHDSFMHNTPEFKSTTFCCTPLISIQSTHRSSVGGSSNKGQRQRRQFRKNIKRFNYRDR